MSKLPKTQHPIIQITIPSTNKTYSFRPFVSKEEKILLIAQHGGQHSDRVQAVTQVIQNCSLDKKFDISKLTTFDFDYVFMKLRASSVNNVVKITVEDQEDGEERTFDINLDQLEIKIPDLPNKATNNDGVTVVVRYPTMDEMTSILARAQQAADDCSEFDIEDELLVACIEKIYNAEEVFDSFSKEELIEFLGEQPLNVSRVIKDYLAHIPDLTHVIEYKNSLGHDQRIVLKGIDDFFTWQ